MTLMDASVFSALLGCLVIYATKVSQWRTQSRPDGCMCLSWICCGPCKLTYLVTRTVCGWLVLLVRGVYLAVRWPFTQLLTEEEGRQPSGSASDAFLRC
jgi:hypothetical protein